jgi:hypothetical protein
VTLFDFLSLKNDVNVPSKSNMQKILCSIRIRQDPDPGSGSEPDPDTLVTSMDPRIRIRIHPKMSWIRNTAYKGPIKGVIKEQPPARNLSASLRRVL